MQPDQKTIRELAYRLWEERGKPEGRAKEDWFAAERRLSGQQKTESRAVDEAAQESFPASDAPASGLPDKPPANADEKWAAADAARARKKRGKGSAGTREPAPGRTGIERAQGKGKGKDSNP